MIRKCLVCEKILTKIQKTFCSRKCLYKYQDKRKVIKCGFCGKKGKWKIKFCSVECKNKSMIGKPSWNKGIPHSEETKKKIGKATIGRKSWNKGEKCLETSGEKNGLWKGDDVGKGALHSWIVRQRGNPTKCEHCGKDGLTGHQIHWANKYHFYERNLDDWIRLCCKCHRKYDIKYNGYKKK